METKDVFGSDAAIDLKSRLEAASNIVLTGHRSPDGDAVGSCLALWNHLKESCCPSHTSIEVLLRSLRSWGIASDGANSIA